MAETGFKKWIITITVIVASLLELIDTTIVNVSLPDIQGNLGATLEDIAWVVTGYSVANVIILPMSGWLGSRFGRKQLFHNLYHCNYHCLIFVRKRHQV